MRAKVQSILEKALGNEIIIRIDVPDREEFGHYSTNAAIRAAKNEGRSPMELAAIFKEKIEHVAPKGIFQKIEIAPPGFLNFWISRDFYTKELAVLLKTKNAYGSSKFGKGKKVQIEYVSANPTGPLTLANGRGGFFGDVLANLLEATGHKVEREYYVNDTGNQVLTLGKSILAALELIPEEENFYKGEYVKEWAKKNSSFVKKNKAKPLVVGQKAATEFLKSIREVLEKKAGIQFNRWTSEEKDIHKKGFVKKAGDLFEKEKLIYKEDGAIWLKTSVFGDDKDRVVVTRDGFPTYFFADAGHYLETKKRGFNSKILILGPDHHGYVKRIEAVAQIVGLDESEIMITQAVRLVKGGEEVKMSKRKGEFVTFNELVEEVSPDVARFFFLMIAPETHLDFDLELAKEHSMKNPVYYVQYAFVRTKKILEKAPKKSIKNDTARILNTPEDLRLMHGLMRFSEVLEDAAKAREAHRVTRYAVELARVFHNFYEKEHVIGELPEVEAARLELVRASFIVFSNLFKILGITKPEKM